MKELIEEKRKGKTIKIEDDKAADPRGSNVVDLMAALKKSLGSSAAAKPKAVDEASKKKPAAKKPAKAEAEATAEPAKAPARKRA